MNAQSDRGWLLFGVHHTVATSSSLPSLSLTTYTPHPTTPFGPRNACRSTTSCCTRAGSSSATNRSSSRWPQVPPTPVPPCPRTRFARSPRPRLCARADGCGQLPRVSCDCWAIAAAGHSVAAVASASGWWAGGPVGLVARSGSTSDPAHTLAHHPPLGPSALPLPCHPPPPRQWRRPSVLCVQQGPRQRSRMMRRSASSVRCSSVWSRCG